MAGQVLWVIYAKASCNMIELTKESWSYKEKKNKKTGG